jgi:sec-independent protein translocase protein TatA
MNFALLFGFMPQGTEWLIILAVVLLLFGGSKLPQLAKALGQSKRAFKEGIDSANEEDAAPKSTQLGGQTPGSLSGVTDEQLFEEAHRRAQEMKR